MDRTPGASHFRLRSRPVPTRRHRQPPQLSSSGVPISDDPMFHEGVFAVTPYSPGIWLRRELLQLPPQWCAARSIVFADLPQTQTASYLFNSGKASWTHRSLDR